MTRTPWLALIVAIAALAGGGCPSEEDLLHLEIVDECENLNPHHCMLPWPSTRYLEEDASTATGWRVAYPAEAFPKNIDDDPFDPSPYHRHDGFPPSAQILTLFPAPVVSETLPPHSDFGASLADGSPTVLLDMDRGERVAHFAEFDVRYDDDEEILLYIRPAKRLEEDTRYAVAIRGLEYVEGGAVEPSPVFAALRDGVTTDADAVEDRRDRMEQVFTALGDAGVARDDLIQAWDFHTASGESLWGDLLWMRDDAMERVGQDGIGCTITDVQDDYSENLFRVVSGTFTAPSYVDSPYPPANLVRDADGRPEYQGDFEVEFRLAIPSSLAQPGATPGPLVTYGHGLLNNDSQILFEWQQSMANELGLVLMSTDYTGLSSADAAADAEILTDLTAFPAIPDRLKQGVVNVLVMTRTMAGVCAGEEAFAVEGQPTFDPDTRLYWGGSLGAIMGTTTLSLSQDWERGTLHVGGSIFPLLQSRSIGFEPLELVFSAWYEPRVDREVFWSVLGHLFDEVDPITYLPHLIDDPLPDTPAKKILYQAGKDDELVHNLGTNVAARTAGLPLIRPTAVEVWGLDDAPATPFDGSALQYWDLGVPPAPVGNEPPDAYGVHYDVRLTTSCMSQLAAFMKADGQIIDACDGECDPD